ncbi:hypothetical protein llap_18617 [Limosa lapponica baueri]|uniref:Uncharacterized protein n=1 Tax=Limosa lapponica baueri TaxID=1758121 RepID=A0A2I0TB99_LIMLA|nr:hypothetical protein llap_18617 [Limosa lapponica baueri]
MARRDKHLFLLNHILKPRNIHVFETWLSYTKQQIVSEKGVNVGSRDGRCHGQKTVDALPLQREGSQLSRGAGNENWCLNSRGKQ